VDNPSEQRRFVLRLYAIVGPMFCGSLFALGRWRVDGGLLLAAVALVAAGALWIVIRRSPRTWDWLFPVAIVPSACCGIGFLACGERGLAYLAVIGAPLAWTAVLFELPIVAVALGTTVVTVFLVLAVRVGPSAAAAGTVLLSPIAALVAWVVFTTARRLREARRELGAHARRAEASEQRYRSMAQELAESQRQLALALEGSGIGYWEWEPRTDRIVYSPLWPALLGYGPEDIEPLFGSWAKLVHADDVARVDEEVIAHLKGRSSGIDMEYRMRVRDGSWRWVHTRGKVMERDGNGRAVLVSGTSEDITRRHDAEDRLREAQEKLVVATRLASVGTLAAGVAHEINNPLAWLTSNLRHALDGLPAAGDGARDPARADLREALDESLQGAERIAGIVKAMRSLGRPTEAEGPLDIDVGAELRNALQMVRNQIVQRARLEVSVPERLPCVRARTNELGRVFLNVLVNAAQAIPEGNAAEHRVLVTARADAGDILVEVADTGAGIPAHVRPRIFDPFFTTKPVGEGTGLGLSIARSIVDGAGGRIEVESEEGKGTTFRVRVPAHVPGDRPAAAPRNGAAAGGAPRARRRVLVIDDEPLVRKSLARELSPHHDVTTLGSAAEALRRIDAGERWDAIFCDLMLPDLDGAGFYEALAARGSDAASRLAFVTGGAFGERSTRFLAGHRVEVITKPVEAEKLLALAERLAVSAE
jgi:PAS domain S-box-containing protein